MEQLPAARRPRTDVVEPQRSSCRREKLEPKMAELSADKLVPNRDKARMDRAEPAQTCAVTESLDARRAWALLLTEREDPNLQIARTEMVEAIVPGSRTERELPRRVNWRSESELEREVHASVDTMSETRALDRIEMLEPRVMKLRALAPIPKRVGAVLCTERDP